MSLTCHKITWHLNSLIAWPFFEMPRSQTKKKGENICKVPGTAHDIETIKVENLLFKKIDTLGIYTNHHTHERKIVFVNDQCRTKALFGMRPSPDR